jgi:hypothetical protein
MIPEPPKAATSTSKYGSQECIMHRSEGTKGFEPVQDGTQQPVFCKKNMVGTFWEAI